MSTSITISYPCQLLSLPVSYNLVPGGHVQSKILIIHVLLIHVSETYSTIMSLHALGISVDVNIRQLKNTNLSLHHAHSDIHYFANAYLFISKVFQLKI
jgi:hypothetical protein